MEKIIDYGQQYPLVLAGFVLLMLVLCWKSEEVRGWVVRLLLFLLILTVLYFAFQKFKYLIPSSQQQPALRDDSLEAEEHAGKKYYKDPEERFKEQQ
ncbi:MAG: hypothetical protein ABFS09_09550 [Thermodesulfobacteriota bacterium]